MVPFSFLDWSHVLLCLQHVSGFDSCRSYKTVPIMFVWPFFSIPLPGGIVLVALLLCSTDDFTVWFQSLDNKLNSHLDVSCKLSQLNFQSSITKKIYIDISCLLFFIHFPMEYQNIVTFIHSFPQCSQFTLMNFQVTQGI